LDRRANALAHWLRGQGVRAEQVVGLGLPRGPGLVTAMLAVWRAGGACLPLDPDLPPARVRHMTGTARPILTLRELPDTTGLPGRCPGSGCSRWPPATTRRPCTSGRGAASPGHGSSPPTA